MTNENIEKVGTLLIDTFIFIQDMRVIKGFLVVAFTNKLSQLDVVYQAIPEGDTDIVVANFLLRLQNQLRAAGNPSYFGLEQ
jgi:hypothetical protein